jgi:hypothetical protein
VIRLALALLILAMLPAAAGAAPFGDLPVQPASASARCLRATGAPGEVVRWAPGGAEFLQATAAGFGAPVKVPLGDVPIRCPVARAQPSGAGVVVAQVDHGIAFAVRDPGGAWGPVQTIAEPLYDDLEDAVAVVNSRGDAVVAWTDLSDDAHDRDTARVLVMRRPAGGTFGPPLELQKPTPYRLDSPRVELGVQDDGTVLALWNRDDPQNSGRTLALFAAAAPGAAFGPPQRVSSNVQFREFSLNVAPDGRALAVVRERGRTRVLERPPGGAFAGVAEFTNTFTVFGTPAVALRPDGAAVVAWQDSTDVQVFAIRRNGPGPFGRPEPVGGKPRSPFGPDLPRLDLDAPTDVEGRGVRAAFTGDGRPVLTWADGSTTGTLDWARAMVATPGDVHALSGPLRDADSITPVILADGTAAAAWSDGLAGDARLHLAVEGAPARAEPPVPRVEFGQIRRIPGGLALPFRCSAACDVRATVPDSVSGTRSLPAAGSARVRIVPTISPIMLRRPDSVAVDVLTGPPGARAAAARTLTAKLRVPPLPRFLGLTAIRRGHHIAVSWRTKRPLRRASVIAVASNTRAPGDPFFGTTVDGEGRRRFRVNVDPLAGHRYVQLFVLYEPDATQYRVAVVRVTKGA